MDTSVGARGQEGSPAEGERTLVVAVVVAYNGESWIADCIGSLQRSTCKVQVLVVDNASTDATMRLCREHAEVHLIRNHRNLGFGAASNQGISMALQLGAKYVLLANQDVVVHPEMLQRLVSQMESNAAFGIAAPLQMTGAGDAIDSIFLRHYLAESGGRFLSDAVQGFVGAAYSLQSAPAAVWLCSSHMLRSVGGFNPLFFMYCEDDDLCRRLRMHGFKLVLVPDARFKHARGLYAGAGLAPWPARLRRRYVRSRSNFVLTSLDPQGKFVVQLWRAAVTAALSGLREFLCHADLLALTSSIGAIGAGLFRWRKMAASRRLVVKSGPHWLSGEI